MTVTSLLLNVTVILALALAAVRLARKSRASVRHVLLATAFVVLSVLPVAPMVAPTMRVAVPAAMQDAFAPLDFGVEPVVASVPPETAAAAGNAIVPRKSRWSWPSTSSLLIAAWITGTSVLLLPVLLGLWQVRALRRSALPWLHGRLLAESLMQRGSSHRRIDVLLHESLPGPMTCGVLRPAIVLPIDAPEWPAEDLRRAIVHEMEHVRRGDWLTQCLARVVAAGYWFHPIVWVAWRQLSLEAERACDDAVLRQSDATAYADQLVVLAERLSAASRQPQLAMANRNDLAARVDAVLDGGRQRGRAGVRCVGTAIAAMAALAFGLASVRLVATQTQTATPTGVRQIYDAATIKPCQAEEIPTGARGAAGGTNATFSPGRFFVPCVTTEQLIYLAYASYGAPDSDHLVNDDPGTASNDKKIRGGPAWVHSLRDKYSIEATAAGATERTVLMGAMLRSLLEDRFHLKIHRETEEVPLLTMSIAKGGFKLKPMKDGDCDPGDGTPPAGPPDLATLNATKPRCGNLTMMNVEGKTRWTFGTGTMSGLANQLSRVLGIHIIDQTNITDKFVFRFEFTRGEDEFATEASVQESLAEQLGLKLDKTKGPRGFIVIDAIERPTPDNAMSPQTPPPAAAPVAQRFEVASIKPCDASGLPPGARGGGGGNISPGHLTLVCQSVKGYIQAAYLMHPDGTIAPPGDVLKTPIEGGPDWISSERYTIEAAAAAGTPTPMMQGPMLQALLEDRFALKVHWEMREIPVYTLAVSGKSPKLTPFREGSCVPPVRMSPPGPQPPLGPGEVRCQRFTRVVGPNLVVDAQGLTLGEFADFFLFLAAGRPVIDKTGIAGKFDFHLEYAPSDDFRKQMAASGSRDSGDPTAADILTAIKDQLGLKLEPSKGPGRFLVINHVERPKPN